MNTKVILGSRIRQRLEELGMKQRDLADKADLTEVTVSRYINGERQPKGSVVARIASALHTTSDYLLGIEALNNNEIICCKDCCFYYRKPLLAEAVCASLGRMVDDNDYCSWAVRREKNG